jgi:hypothetical protein
MVTGYPKLHPLDEGYWEKFWRIRAAMMENRAVRRGEGAFPDSSESSAC